MNNKVAKEIERLQDNEIKPSEHNANVILDSRITKMLKRLRAYESELKMIQDRNDNSSIISYANTIAQAINWNSDSIDDRDNMLDSFRILVSIMNLICDDNANFLNLEMSKRNANTILKRIHDRSL